MPKEKLGHAVPAEDAGAAEQHLSDAERELVDNGYRLFEAFREATRDMRERARDCRKMYLLDDPHQDEPGVRPEARAPQLHTLKSTIISCVADQMDNMPEAVLHPERADLQDVAEDITDVVRYVMDQNNFEDYYRRRVLDYYVTGTSVTQLMWDPDMGNGRGEVSLLRWPIENLYWDPMCDDIQDARAVFKAGLHPLSWYAEHYPEEAKYVRVDEYAHEDRAGMPQRAIALDPEEEVLLLEYWYRRYDAKSKRYQVHVAHMAGRALLYCSEREHPEGVYKHGEYPFVLDVFTQIDGAPIGNGMVWEFANMQRYVNRYAQYIDQSARAAAKIRLLVNKAANIDPDALADWNRNIIEGDSIGENSLRWFQSVPLSGQVSAQMTSFQEQIKMDSGQNQFSRGEGGLGVTAASAIAALQEAGGKTARLNTTVLNGGFRRIVKQVVWLLSQYYDEERTLLITGRNGKDRDITLSGKRMLGGKTAGKALPAPPYTVQVQIQRRNPMRIQAQNEFMLQVAQMKAQAGEPLPVTTVVETLQVDGKERILPVLREADQTQAIMQQMAQQAQQAQQMAEQQQQQTQAMAAEMDGMRRVLAEQQRVLAAGPTNPM